MKTIANRKKHSLPEVDTDSPSSRFKCVCAYDGTDFCGWQSQPCGMSIQDFIEKRLSNIFKKKIRIHGSGRTDAGVHADAQVFHFDAQWRHSEEALLSALKSGYPDSLQIISLKRVSEKFHARYSAKGKRYVYSITEGRAAPKTTRYSWSLGNRVLNVEAVNAAAKILLGTHDFTSFSASRGADAKDNPVKTLFQLEAKRRGKLVVFTTRGSGYMYKMVRLIVGALVEVGLGKLSPDDISRILESKKRGSNKFQAAPAKGLTLNRVYYSPIKPRPFI